MTRTMLIALAIASLGIAMPAYAAGDVAAGKAKATNCAMCHGPNGEGTSIAPKLAGKSPAELQQALGDYKSGKRENAMMKSQAASLSDADMADLAAYYGSLK